MSISPYRDPHAEITLPPGVKCFQATYENIEAVFSYSAHDGTSSSYTKKFECEWNHKHRDNDNVYHLYDTWERSHGSTYWNEIPCKNASDIFDDFVSRSKTYGIIKHDNIWVPWDRLDKILIVTREPVQISFLWRDKK